MWFWLYVGTSVSLALHFPVCNTSRKHLMLQLVMGTTMSEPRSEPSALQTLGLKVRSLCED